MPGIYSTATYVISLPEHAVQHDDHTNVCKTASYFQVRVNQCIYKFDLNEKEMGNANGNTELNPNTHENIKRKVSASWQGSRTNCGLPAAVSKEDAEFSQKKADRDLVFLCRSLIPDPWLDFSFS